MVTLIVRKIIHEEVEAPALNPSDITVVQARERTIIGLNESTIKDFMIREGYSEKLYAFFTDDKILSIILNIFNDSNTKDDIILKEDIKEKDVPEDERQKILEMMTIDDVPKKIKDAIIEEHEGRTP